MVCSTGWVALFRMKHDWEDKLSKRNWKIMSRLMVRSHFPAMTYARVGYTYHQICMGYKTYPRGVSR